MAASASTTDAVAARTRTRTTYADTNTNTNANNTNPFILPELIHRLSRFTTLHDSLSCALVCRAFSEIFIPVIWFSVDFDLQPRFTGLPSSVVTKHGHHIRIVENIQSCAEVRVLANPQVQRLRKIKYMDTTGSNLQHILGFEIVSRNSASLVRLDLVPDDPVPVGEENRLANYIQVTALIPPFGSPQASKLYRLCIMDLHLTFEGLMTIFHGCPQLTKLGLVNVTILGKPTNPQQLYQHPNISFLSCLHQALFRTDPLDRHQPTPSLLLHLPHLKTIELCDHEVENNPSPSTLNTIPPRALLSELSRHCPNLTGLRVQGLRDCTDLVSAFCSTPISRQVSELAFDYDHISLGIITSLLLHPQSLTSVKIYRGVDFILDRDVVPIVDDHFWAQGQFMQLVPRTCKGLRILDIHLHEMDMDVVEMGKWVCKDLRRLRVRIKGLDTRERILETIALWRKEWRARRNNLPSSLDVSNSNSNGNSANGQTNDLSIEERVVRHLLKLENLEIVWLGCQDWSPF
ncbi:hypothetical protein BG015_000539 [Linnemannia schmuckeri]|uniref:F-box domain-containing protein n=1 Tax=Linnemannia schmuckeri TaxID=64567 RepID=A0A9P5RQX5_9FUNG|nr:hypothetical protein BG015_000539 [Linnemannia schmuckeri]